MSGDKVTIPKVISMKEKGEKISMITAYDFTGAKIVDEAGIDIILVGDSLGMVMQGRSSTLPVTIDDVIYHTRMVKNGTKRALVVGDMPFMSYQVSVEEAVKNAGRLIQEGGAEAVKLEGGREFVDRIKAIVSCGIPVMGHLGLTPQSINIFGGYRVRGRKQEEAKRIIEDAKYLQEAGVFSIVLEAMPLSVAKEITESVSIPTIGIGASKLCDGQVLVFHDLLGLFEEFKPKFVKRYAHLKQDAVRAVRQYIDEVKKGIFPDEEHSYL
ncbi:MAG: 3-methyl-2-oxobutanoate hydroxymethyltransferase [Deltaproteobacteria bacterium]|nr:3-methyl-2-oxobutanoate hydroxymethyltransferase [Deltaproteobacteria bacterium]